jgi:Ca2+-binding RTX toxin-like protein
MEGGSGDDSLYGYKGKDTLTGGLGRDILYGEDDADRFDFNALKDSVVGGARDIIRDFSRSGGDRIDLSALDANYHKSGNQSFSFIGGKAFTDKEGQLHFVKKSGGVYVEGDVNGDGRADFQISVKEVGGLDRGDFIL